MWSQLIRHDKLRYLNKSKFRGRFRLDDADRFKAILMGREKLLDDAKEILAKNLNNPGNSENDGRQTPYHGHPVFTAQHATATCCRKCMLKWHRIPMFRDLRETELNYCADLIVKWIEKETVRSHTP
jgi:hypothetical protein